MSLKDKTKDVLEAGKAERGNFTPTGKPKELYLYWLERSDSFGALRVREGSQRENFCHYWRVVALWAPLMKLRDKFGDRNLAIGGLTVLAVILLSVFGWGMTFPGFREVVLILVIVTLGAAAIAGVCVGLVWLEQNRGFPLGKIIEYGFGIALIGVLVFAIVGLHVIAIQNLGLWLGLLAIYGGLVVVLIALFAVLAAGAGIGELVSGVRSLREKKTAEKYEADPNYVPPAKKAKGFFSSIGDFLVLLGQVVRVNKWKICPLVDIEVKHD